jgi:glycosyltransferase involved in cell wall biosynthesis
MKRNNLIVLGIRGIPAKHGGFETFAEYLCKYLQQRDWNITVYCQEDGKGATYESEWQGVTRIHIPVSNQGPLGTILFDFKSIWHARKKKGLHLTLGYNTACFNLIQRLYGITNVINMDGIEWKRQKWGKIAKAWFWSNERCGCWFGNHLIADHPRIEDHLATRVSPKKITMIPYGAPTVNNGDENILAEYGLEKNKYSIVIARPEPENSFLEIVTAFSKNTRGQKLVVLGTFTPETHAYHKAVMAAASDEVIFPGAIYDFEKVGALRFYSRFYIHGHQVGGTNPSLVEALGAGCAVIAHDNHFNRWVAANGAYYFSDINALSTFFETDYLDDEFVHEIKVHSKQQFIERFQWDDILAQYEILFLNYTEQSKPTIYIEDTIR